MQPWEQELNTIKGLRDAIERKATNGRGLNSGDKKQLRELKESIRRRELLGPNYNQAKKRRGFIK